MKIIDAVSLSGSSRIGLDALTRKMAKGVSIAFIGTIIGNILTFALNIMLTRVLGPADYGIYTMGISVTNIAQSIGTLGLNLGLVRFCPIYRSCGD